ncbi:MAG: hypothetical protein ABIG89_00015 [Candidatus Woesearchaeota archaeon]
MFDAKKRQAVTRAKTLMITRRWQAHDNEIIASFSDPQQQIADLECLVENPLSEKAVDAIVEMKERAGYAAGLSDKYGILLEKGREGITGRGIDRVFDDIYQKICDAQPFINKVQAGVDRIIRTYVSELNDLFAEAKKKAFWGNAEERAAEAHKMDIAAYIYFEISSRIGFEEDSCCKEYRRAASRGLRKRADKVSKDGAKKAELRERLSRDYEFGRDDALAGLGCDYEQLRYIRGFATESTNRFAAIDIIGFASGKNIGLIESVSKGMIESVSREGIFFGAAPQRRIDNDGGKEVNTILYRGRTIPNIDITIPYPVKDFVTPDNAYVQDVLEAANLFVRNTSRCDDVAMEVYRLSRKHFKYVDDKKSAGVLEYWFFPAELIVMTDPRIQRKLGLDQKKGMKNLGGDCDDWANLTASLLIGSGIPEERVYVGCGITRGGGGHATVFYQSDIGVIYHINSTTPLDMVPLDLESLPTKDDKKDMIGLDIEEFRYNNRTAILVQNGSSLLSNKNNKYSIGLSH